MILFKEHVTTFQIITKKSFMTVDELITYKEFYDNVHGFIKVTELESKIIDSPFFQRLRNIRQLGLIDYVFPGALHNRFNHSLGVLQIADKMIVSLQENYGEKYLFSWDEILENDSVKFANILEQEYDIDWAKTAKFEKNNNDNSMRVSTSTNCILLKLNDEKTEINLEKDGDIIDKFRLIVKIENNKINIYGKDKEITGKREILRMAALLHDIGHYPLSHLVESVIRTDAKSKIKSDEISLEKSNDNKIDLDETDIQKLICDIHNRESSFDFSHHELMATVVIFKTQIHKILKECFTTEQIRSIAQIIAGNYPGPLGLIIHSELDADRFDYLLRDSHQTGVTYGLFDLDQIIRNLEYVSKDNKLAVNEKARRAVEHYLVCRYFLYSTVIFHKTSVAFELMIKKVYSGLMERKLFWSYFDLIDIFKSHDSAKEYLMYDDSYFFNVLKDVANGKRDWDSSIEYDIPDDFLFELIDKVLNRKPLKECIEEQKFINPLEEEPFNSRFLDEIVGESIIKKAEIEDYWYIPFEMSIPITDIHPYRSSSDISKSPRVHDETIKIVKKSDSGVIEKTSINLVDDKTSIVHVLSKHELKINRLYTKNDEYKEKLRKAFDNISVQK